MTENNSNWMSKRVLQVDAQTPSWVKGRKPWVASADVNVANLERKDSAEESDLVPNPAPAPENAPDPTSVFDEEDKRQLKIAQQKGFEEGRLIGMEEGRRVQQTESNAEDVVALAGLMEQILRESRSLVIELATCMAERILHHEVSLDPDWVHENIRTCMEGQKIDGPVRLKVHPDVHRQLDQRVPRPNWLEESSARFELVPDAKLGLGDCIIESDQARIDARLPVQLDILKEILKEAVAGVLFASESEMMA
jgi:flagellar biosynthesis/type III secretory pathway protein FliH